MAEIRLRMAASNLRVTKFFSYININSSCILRVRVPAITTLACLSCMLHLWVDINTLACLPCMLHLWVDITTLACISKTVSSNQSKKFPPWLENTTNSSILAQTLSSVFWILTVFSSLDGLNLRHFKHQAIRDSARTCAKVWALSSYQMDYLQYQFF